MSDVYAELARLGSARRSTRRRAARGLVDLDLEQLVPGSRACGPGADGPLRRRATT